MTAISETSQLDDKYVITVDGLAGSLGLRMEGNMSLLHALLLLATSAAVSDSQQPSKSPPCLGQTSPGFLNRIRLDTARHAYLLATADAHGNALYAIQYERGESNCPTVLDSVTYSDGSNPLRKVFVYECSVAGHKGQAAVALTKIDGEGRRLAMMKVWLIDPGSLHFVPVTGKTTCSDKGYAGEDKGGDVLSGVRR
jgi:hypothetical protein